MIIHSLAENHPLWKAIGYHFDFNAYETFELYYFDSYRAEEIQNSVC